MNKRIIGTLIIVLVLLFLVGCTPTPTAETEEPANPNPPVTPTEPVTEDPDPVPIGEMTEAGYIDISAEEAKNLIDSEPDLVIVDVSPKYDEGHIPGAINYYVGNGTLDTAIPNLDMSKPYLVYCHVDSASISGSKKLVEAGFDPVYRLVGNYAAWVDAGYPIEK